MGSVELGGSGADEHLSERKRALMEAYFTTPASYNDLRSLAGGVTQERVKQLIHYGYRELWHHLPPEMRKEYPFNSPKYFEFPHKKYRHRRGSPPRSR